MAKIKPVINPCVLPKNINGQIAKVLDEYQEALESWLTGNTEHADEEFMDVMVACRTYFFLRGYNDEAVDALYAKVEAKNARRNYYQA